MIGLIEPRPWWKFWRRRVEGVEITRFPGPKHLTLDEYARQFDVLFIPVSRELFEREEGKPSKPVTYCFERTGHPQLVDLVCTTWRPE